VFDGTDLVDYQGLDRWTDAAARAHAEAGLRAGDRIGIIGDNSLEWVVAAIGALKLGAVVVPFNNRFTPDELRYLIDDAEPALVPGARIIYVLSMSGAPGLLWHILHPLTRGLSIFYERGFEPARTLRRLAEAKIQIMAGVPVLFEQMAKLPDFAAADLSSL